MTRALLPLLAALAAFALLADRAEAQTCSCTKYESARQFVGFSDVIFKGKALSSKTKYDTTMNAKPFAPSLESRIRVALGAAHRKRRR
jgi:hypothetical protein